jgi:hypothetical protein
VPLLALLSACGTNRPTIPEDYKHDDSGTGGAAYPSGPFAQTTSDVGMVVKDLTFQKGWTNPKAQGYDTSKLAPISVHDFYDPDGAKGYSILVINTAAVWCSACKAEHGGTGSKPSLAERMDQLGSQGLVILSTLFQDAQRNPATETHLAAWAEGFETNFPFALDPESQVSDAYGVSTELAPLNLVVDARTMKLMAGAIGDTMDWEGLGAELEKKRGK